MGARSFEIGLNGAPHDVGGLEFQHNPTLAWRVDFMMARPHSVPAFPGHGLLARSRRLAKRRNRPVREAPRDVFDGGLARDLLREAVGPHFTPNAPVSLANSMKLFPISTCRRRSLASGEWNSQVDPKLSKRTLLCANLLLVRARAAGSERRLHAGAWPVRSSTASNPPLPDS